MVLSKGSLGMADYILKALAKADIASDYGSLRLHLETDQGSIKLALNARQLDTLVERLQGVQLSAAAHASWRGTDAPNPKKLQMEIVERVQGTTGIVNNVDSMVLVLGSGRLSRAFAFDHERFIALAQVVMKEIPTMKAKAH